MVHDPLQNLDLSLLLNMPRLSAKAMAALSRAILWVMPDNLPPNAVKAAGQVKTRLHEFDNALMRLRREYGLATPAQESAFDTATDGAWIRFRNRLQDWEAHERPGFVALAKEPDTEVDYGELIELANDARAIRTRLFSLGGTNILRASYPEQAESTRSILALIDEDGLADRIEELVGPHILPVLRDCQVRYDAMVSNRATRSNAKDNSDNLRTHQLGMMRALRRYASAMLGAYDDEDPKTGEFVYRTLQPILTFRERLDTRSAGGPIVDEDEVLEELAAELEAEFGGDEVEPDEPELVDADA